jgi:electron transfer flavoprotein beta subunit
MTDRAVGGSDTLATSYILSCVAKHLGPFDVIFCGKQAIDGDTGQVGPEMARHLDIPQITYATRVEAEDGTVKVTREVEDGWEVIAADCPVLITVNKTEKEPRMATLRSKMAANRAVIGEIHAADLPEMDLSRVGLNGSPTKVKKTFCPERSKNGMILSGKAADEAAGELLRAMAGAGLIH